MQSANAITQLHAGYQQARQTHSHGRRMPRRRRTRPRCTRPPHRALRRAGDEGLSANLPASACCTGNTSIDLTRRNPQTDEAGQLDNLARRFSWFHRLLQTHELEQGRVFPGEWRVGWFLAARFADITR